MRPQDITAEGAGALLQPITTDYTRQITDYLAGRFLGPDKTSVAYYTGPLLPSSHPGYSDMVTALRRACAADNLLVTTLETFIDAVEGLESWRLVPEGQTDAPEDKSDDEEALTAYLDRLGVTGFLYRVALSLCAHGRVPGRPILSPRARDEQGNIKPARDLAHALSRIHWQAPDWPTGSRMVSVDQAAVLQDDDLEPYSLIVYSAERTENGLKRTVKGTEVSWVDEESGLTHFRVIEEGKPADETVWNLGGRLMLVQTELPRAFVMPSMVGSFASYIVACTMLNTNTHYAGMVEEYGIGIQPPGQWRNTDGTLTGTPKDESSTFEPAHVPRGPGRRNFYQPAMTVESTRAPDGTTTESERAVPAQLGQIQPTDPTYMTTTMDVWRKAIRRDARQSFLELADATDPSGRARETAAGDYLTAGKRLADALMHFVRNFLELTVNLAALQLPDGDAARLRSYRAVVDARVKAFPPSPEERRQNLEEWKEKLIDEETAVIRTGVSDPEPVMERTKVERAQAQEKALALAQATKPQPQEVPNG